MGQRQVAAEWAWISKEPGSHEDYAILAASTGPAGVQAFARTYVAGVPSSEATDDAPAASPWVTFGSHETSADRRLLSISVQDPWGARDQARRPIWPRRFFLCWYEDIASACASYRSLWNAVAPLELPRPDRGPVRFMVGPQSLGDVLTAIDELGFDQVAAIAAALLDGPVAVTGTIASRLTKTSMPADRLAILDAVAALLPYGFRACLSASTAVDNTVAHRIRLILADYASGSQQSACLVGPPLQPRSDLGGDYLTMLLAKKRRDGLEAVVSFLRDAASPCSFEHADEALRILDGLNQSRYRVLAAVDGAEGLKLSQEFFQHDQDQVARAWHSSELDRPTRIKLLRPLLDTDASDRTGILDRHWEAVADEYGALVRGRLDTGDLDSAIHAIAVADSQPDALATDRLLKALVCAPGEPTETFPDRVAIQADLLRQLPVPEPGAFGLTYDALRLGPLEGWQGQLVRELLSRELAAGPAAKRAAAWVAWLSGPGSEGAAPGRPDWPAGLRAVLGTTELTSRSDNVRQLFQAGVRWATLALALAEQAGRSCEVLGVPGLADDLAELAATATSQSVPAEIRRDLASALGTVRWDGLDPAAVAAVDVARLLLGGELSDFPDQVTQPELSRYEEGLRRVLRLRVPRDMRSGLSRQFELPLSRALALAILRRTIEQVVVDPSALPSRVERQFVVRVSKTALALYRARLSGMSSTQILQVMKNTQVNGVTLAEKVSYRALDDLLIECEFLLSRAVPLIEQGGANALDEFRELICAGVLGAGYGSQYRRFLDQRLRAEEAARKQLRRRLRRLSASLAKQAYPGRGAAW